MRKIARIFRIRAQRIFTTAKPSARSVSIVVKEAAPAKRGKPEAQSLLLLEGPHLFFEDLYAEDHFYSQYKRYDSPSFTPKKKCLPKKPKHRTAPTKESDEHDS